MEDFRIVRVHQRELNPDEKVRCTLYRLKPGTYTPKQHKKSHSLGACIIPKASPTACPNKQPYILSSLFVITLSTLIIYANASSF